jgi:lipopolysaccharide transport system permease protein
MPTRANKPRNGSSGLWLTCLTERRKAEISILRYNGPSRPRNVRIDVELNMIRYTITPLKNIWKYREAIRNLALLNLRIRYSSSILGFLWSLGNPLFFMCVLTFVFTVLLPNTTQNYPIFVLSAMLPWNFFQTALMGSIASLPNGRELLTKLAFPSEVLLLACVLAELVNFSMALVTIIVILTLLGSGPGWAVLTLPLLILILCVFTVGVGMLLATINVRLRDTQEFMNVFLFGWFFLTPIVYSLDAVARNRFILGISARTLIQALNPLASLLETFRQVLYLHQWPDWTAVVGAGLPSVLVLIVGFLVFEHNSPSFAEEI